MNHGHTSGGGSMKHIAAYFDELFALNAEAQNGVTPNWTSGQLVLADTTITKSGRRLAAGLRDAALRIELAESSIFPDAVLREVSKYLHQQAVPMANALANVSEAIRDRRDYLLAANGDGGCNDAA
ncbi:hypothetical protein THUN1379_26920 [Paludibacterium sp. THUN1379]|nr:hypothetical protein THUN1379_26920 [Paludibacterium sp. THUN1379]